jgi:hypothetical protein
MIDKDTIEILLALAILPFLYWPANKFLEFLSKRIEGK